MFNLFPIKLFNHVRPTNEVRKANNNEYLEECLINEIARLGLNVVRNILIFFQLLTRDGKQRYNVGETLVLEKNAEGVYELKSKW